jgi:hypothetical protein
MMPTSPRSPLLFGTAGFPQYGWKAGLSDEASRAFGKPAAGVHREPLDLRPSFVHPWVMMIGPLGVGRATR